ncbi:MAG: hypothetical protein ACQESR_10380 [Planctomycetota bacterium]
MKSRPSFDGGIAVKTSVMALTLLLSGIGLGNCLAADLASEPGEVIPETPTLTCLGVRWWIGSDDNANARIAVAYRPVHGPNISRQMVVSFS